jgi:hypothetical protein
VSATRPDAFLIVDGENIDATLGASVLGRRPAPEERPRWDRVRDYAGARFEIIGNDPEKLRSYYGDLFGWEFDTPSPVAQEVRRRRRRSMSTAPQPRGSASFDDPQTTL